MQYVEMSKSYQLTLDSLTLEAIAKQIQDGRIEKESVIVLVGAGMSTAAGVPDFRSPSSGIYAQLARLGIKTPTDVFTLSSFQKNPKPFYEVCKLLLPDRLYPTLAHYFVKLLDNKNLLLRCYSQNVDGLELLSQLSESRLVLAHGSFAGGYCTDCGLEVDWTWMREQIKTNLVPHCSRCNGVVKPNVKLFGERLDARFYELGSKDFSRCKLLIIIGTSLTVMPVACLPRLVSPTCIRLFINKTPVEVSSSIWTRICMRAVQLFMSSGLSSAQMRSGPLQIGCRDNKRDVAFTGTCDEGVMALATLLGWQDELKALSETGNQNLEGRYEAREL